MRIIITILILCGINSTYGQQDLIDTLAEQAVKIDSLKKVVEKYKQSDNENQTKLLKLQDTINVLKSDLSEFENVRDDKNNLEKQLKLTIDSLIILKSNLLDKDNQLTTQIKSNKEEVLEAREASRNKVITSVVAYYTTTSFDDLIEFSTEQSVRNDRKIIGNKPDLESLLSDIENSLSARKLLEIKFDASKVKNAEIQLNQIKRESKSLVKLINTLNNYQIYNDGLKKTIAEIKNLDGRESVMGMPREIQNKKFNKIIIELSDYIYTYDFNFIEYPYLSEVLFEVIKLKAGNPDADILDLEQKL